MADYSDMPCYRSHKFVRALKISRIGTVPGQPNSRILDPEDKRYLNILVDHDFVAKHKPFAGGYFIVYEDRYQSFSPAAAFEGDYELCEEPCDPPLGSNPSSAEMNQTQTDNIKCEGSDPKEESCTAETSP